MYLTAVSAKQEQQEEMHTRMSVQLFQPFKSTKRTAHYTGVAAVSMQASSVVILTTTLTSWI